MLIGPGGAGKGTVAEGLLARDPHLWLSRSWTTRPRREGEPVDAYDFVDDAEFVEHVKARGFLEHAEFLGHRYGTPAPAPPRGDDVLLDIDVQGARQIRARFGDAAVVVLLLPPSEDVQRERLRERGDPDDQVRRRVERGREEVREGRELAHHVVVNDEVGRAVEQVAAIVKRARSERERLQAVPKDEPPENH